MKLVKQEKFGYCSAACIAMVLGKPLHNVAWEVQRAYGITLTRDGMSDVEMCGYLSVNGIPSPRTVTSRPDQRPAILTVPSLNHSGLLHYVVWDGEQYLDPSEGPLIYPDNAPTIRGEKQVCWACAIIWGPLDTFTF